MSSVRAKRLPKHMLKVHKTIIGDSKDSVFVQIKARVQQKRTLTAKIPVRPRAERSKDTTTDKTDRHERWKEQLQKLQTPFPKNLDATRPYAHAYRELGKYGSHPSHDGFDDESEA